MLWLLRHAEAADGHPDEARPLTPRGIEQARIAGLALARMDVKLGCCLSSPKRRAIETARLACEPLDVEIVTEPAIAGATYEPELLTAGYDNAMLVGHNPSISDVLRDMTGARVQFRKGGIAAVRRGQLVLLMTPQELAAIAGVESV
ncbi:MAG TPA: phosphoglycerate mutase family protein [Solirubrobacteraceae bacterium]|jgi:phosphohistidine phosphatase|nr:phosphoglycerate mutase family protein [Solirubrobacteraceae bacterium]